MKPFDRGILAIYSFTVSLLTLSAIAYLAGWQTPWLYFQREIIAPGNTETIWALLIIYALMGLYLAIQSVYVKRQKQAVVHEKSMGQVRVSLPAIEDLAEKTAYAVQGIKETKARVRAVPQGVRIDLQVVVAPDINVPLLSEDLQQQVKDKIYDVVGISVHEVRVAVESFFARKTRVE